MVKLREWVLQLHWHGAWTTKYLEVNDDLENVNETGDNTLDAEVMGVIHTSNILVVPTKGVFCPPGVMLTRSIGLKVISCQELSMQGKGWWSSLMFQLHVEPTKSTRIIFLKVPEPNTNAIIDKQQHQDPFAHCHLTAKNFKHFVAAICRPCSAKDGVQPLENIPICMQELIMVLILASSTSIAVVLTWTHYFWHHALLRICIFITWQQYCFCKLLNLGQQNWAADVNLISKSTFNRYVGLIEYVLCSYLMQEKAKLDGALY